MAYQIADALAEAHKHGLVHRDIKPSNVQLTPEGQAKLLDFGLARSTCDRMTNPGVLLGSIDYLAPEQARDASSVDIRADIYGLGGVLFWCLTGQPPFPTRDNLADALAQRMTEQPPSVRDHRPDLPVGLGRRPDPHDGGAAGGPLRDAAGRHGSAAPVPETGNTRVLRPCCRGRSPSSSGRRLGARGLTRRDAPRY